MIVAPLLLSGLLLIDTPSQPVAAQANEVVMFTFLGGVGGYDTMCEGTSGINSDGWTIEPVRRFAFRRPNGFRVLSEIRGFGSFIVGLREVEAGFESAAVGATVATAACTI